MSSSGVNLPGRGPRIVEIDPAKEASALAQLFFDLSDALDEFAFDNLNHMDPHQHRRLKDMAQQLDTQAHLLTAEAIGETLKSIQGNLKQIKDTTADASEAVANLNAVSKVISIATAGVTLAVAIASGNVESIGAGAVGLAQVIQ